MHPGATGELNVAKLFNHYELAGVEVDHTKNVGIKSTIKTLLSVSERDVETLSNAVWFAPGTNIFREFVGRFQFFYR